MIRILNGDCLTELPKLAAAGERFHACVTDPPYHLTSGNAVYDLKLTSAGNARVRRGSKGGFMGKQWDGGDIAFRPETWRKVYDCLLPGAYLLAFGSTRGYHRMACAIEDAGFELRDCIMWMFASGFPKSHDVSKAIDATILHGGSHSRQMKQANESRPGEGRLRASTTNNGIMGSGTGPKITRDEPATPEAARWAGWGSSLKPAYEPIIVARKPLDGTIAGNVLKHGCGGLNIDASRVECEERPMKEHRKNNVPGNVYNGASLNGSVSAGTTNVGRWPANVIIDDSQQVADAFAAFGSPDTDSPARFFYSCANDYSLPNSNANGISGACTQKHANIAVSHLLVSKEDSVSALTSVVTRASCGETQLKDCQGLGETVTATNLTRLCESVTTAILSIASNAWHGQRRDTHSLLDNGVRIATLQTRTGITTITISHWKSDGSADHVTCSIMPTKTQNGEPFGISRFHFCGKADAEDRAGSKHPTVKPASLMRYLVKLITPPGGTVLDPFAGSGSTLLAADQLGFNAVGIEMDPTYAEDARRKVTRDAGMFAEVETNAVQEALL